MINNTKLPENIRSLLNGKSKRVLFLQKSDLTIDRKFGCSYLILTDIELISISQNTVTANYQLDNIKDIRNEELLGGGRIVIETAIGTYHIIYYSNHLVPHFADAVRLISDHLSGTTDEPPAFQGNSFCQKCNSPLPERDGNCPRCVPRLKILKRIISLTFPYKSKVLLLMLITSVGVAFQVLPPYITKKIVDDVIGAGHVDHLYMYTGAMIGSGILYLIMRLLNIQLTSWISAKIVTDLRSRLHTVIQYLKLSFFSRREPGELVSRIMFDTGELQQFLVDGMPFLLINSISFIVVCVILLKISWSLTIFVFIPVPLLVFGSSWFMKKLHPLFLRQGSTIGHLNSVLSESMQGLRVIKAFRREQHRIKMFDSVNNRLAHTQVKTQRIFGCFNEVMYWVMTLGVAFVWFFATKMITGKNPSLTLGDLLAFVGYIWLFYGPLQWFSVILNWMTQAFAGAERIFEVIDTKPETYDHPDAVSPPLIKGEIEFRNIRFSYEQGKEVIKDVSFKIAPGEIIGLIGRSGAGKSTIINLINRFFVPQSGEILIDGIDIGRIHLSKLRESMGIVMQEPFLFNTTIAENIAYGNENVSFSKIVEAAKAAHAHDFIIRKPEGYDTIVGECGMRLSGGEKQRISIARAVLHNPPILILDEATSSVDATTESHIQEAISNLIKGRTTIAIAHRLSTLRNANRLIVLSEGRVAEIGTHDELMMLNGIYADLVGSYTQTNMLQSVMWGG